MECSKKQKWDRWVTVKPLGTNKKGKKEWEITVRSDRINDNDFLDSCRNARDRILQLVQVRDDSAIVHWTIEGFGTATMDIGMASTRFIRWLLTPEILEITAQKSLAVDGLSNLSVEVMSENLCAHIAATGAFGYAAFGVLVNFRADDLDPGGVEGNSPRSEGAITV